MKYKKGERQCSVVKNNFPTSWPTVGLSSLLFSTGHTAVKLSDAEAADRAQCAAPD